MAFANTFELRKLVTRDAKFRPGGPAGLFEEPGLRALGLCRARGRRSQCIMHWLPGFVRCLKDAGRARCWAQQISCGAGLGSGLAFGELFAPLLVTLFVPRWPPEATVFLSSRRVLVTVFSRQDFDLMSRPREVTW